MLQILTDSAGPVAASAATTIPVSGAIFVGVGVSYVETNFGDELSDGEAPGDEHATTPNTRPVAATANIARDTV